jgi:3-hydroxyacyl-[acyl-carrier-protein] dehydratase
MSTPFDLPTRQQVLELVPQQRPFRFIDEILELDEQKISGKYTFRHDETFYAGHFPGKPITPGVILLESMAQVGIVAHGLYLFAVDAGAEWPVKLRNCTTFFTDANVEFLSPVLPGQTVTIKAERVFWRRRKIRSVIEMYRGDELVARATASGMGVFDV